MAPCDVTVTCERRLPSIPGNVPTTEQQLINCPPTMHNLSTDKSRTSWNFSGWRTDGNTQCNQQYLSKTHNTASMTLIPCFHHLYPLINPPKPRKNNIITCINAISSQSISMTWWSLYSSGLNYSAQFWMMKIHLQLHWTIYQIRDDNPKITREIQWKCFMMWYVLMYY